MSHDLPAAEPGWVHGHSHDPNPEPPPGDATIAARLPDGATVQLSVATLRALPYREIGDCYIVSTGHGTSGPFVFGGVTLADLRAAAGRDLAASRAYRVAIMPAAAPAH